MFPFIKQNQFWKQAMNNVFLSVGSTIPDKTFGTKWSKTGHEKKSLVSVFACFLTATRKVYVLEGRLGNRLCVHPSLIFF